MICLPSLAIEDEPLLQSGAALAFRALLSMTAAAAIAGAKKRALEKPHTQYFTRTWADGFV